MGYTSLYFARIHYLEKQIRLKNKTLEFNWKTSDDIGFVGSTRLNDASKVSDSQIFTGAFFQDNYGPPEGFCWDALCGDDPIMDNPALEEYNVQKKVDDFVDHVKKQVKTRKRSYSQKKLRLLIKLPTKSCCWWEVISSIQMLTLGTLI